MANSYIQTYTGKMVRPLLPGGIEFCIEDIAASLARMCRFGGHCREFYSVASHSLHVAAMVPPWNALWGLLHDAHEAYVCDIPTPLKWRAGFFVGSEGWRSWGDAERRIQADICCWVGLPTEEPESVKVADARMLATERQRLMIAADDPSGWGEMANPYDHLQLPILCGDKDGGEAKFLDMFLVLRKKFDDPAGND